MARPVAQTAFERRPARRLLWLAAAVAAVWALAASAMSSVPEQGASSLRTAVLSAADQCAAVEGAYPASLDRLVEGYGIRFDPDAYDVRYEVFADNVPPTVEVVRR